MDNKFIILISEGGEDSIYIADDWIDAEGFLVLYCENVLYKGGMVKGKCSDFAYGILDDREFSIEIFCPGEYKNVKETDYFKEIC